MKRFRELIEAVWLVLIACFCLYSSLGIMTLVDLKTMDGNGIIIFPCVLFSAVFMRPLQVFGGGLATLIAAILWGLTLPNGFPIVGIVFFIGAWFVGFFMGRMLNEMAQSKNEDDILSRRFFFGE